MNNLYDPETFEIDRFQDFYIKEIQLLYSEEIIEINKDKFFHFKEPIDQWIDQIRKRFLLKMINEVPLRDLNLLGKQDALRRTFNDAQKEILQLNSLIDSEGQEILIEKLYDHLPGMKNFELFWNPNYGAKDTILYSNSFNIYNKKFSDLISLLYVHCFNMFIMKENDCQSSEQLKSGPIPFISVDLFGSSKWQKSLYECPFERNVQKYFFILGV